MSIISYLQLNPIAFTVMLGCLGLIVGSFLNVVIHRLPIMMERDWRAQCQELLEITTGSSTEPERYNLLHPASRCPKCGHRITPLENIPILSYLLQGGRCKSCRTRISVRYPLVEFVSAIMVGVVAWHFGFSWATVGGALLTWALICASGIDLDHQLLPDCINLPFLWLGLAFNLFGVYTDLHSSVIGAIAGYLSLWSVYILFKLVTGKEGMGHGDFKLLALLGAWLGWQALPVIIILSSLVGAIVGMVLIVFRSRDRSKPIPFGPYLAAAGWIAFLWGADLTKAYLNWASGG
jgi:leader peptidase (prepilin peptidase)/N-methyltransferase